MIDPLALKILYVSTITILMTMLLAIVRAFMGPSVYDRILAVNMFGTKTVILIGVIGYLTGRPAFLDIALVYALMNFITTIAILRYSDFVESPEPKFDVASDSISDSKEGV